ncbi:hypothetical protein B0J13DRAFT_678664 [Dactylonectria estremocensis]|uniref:RRM domain-containing protein n=1 Tax=Dactylonectria estremocensis TaxID=1079267 RepID=A0A9P9E7X0_9HYPO|nr:hypothetical protein B0J13DRAFT_678664 [Dactylonectria estremocensis]
MLTANSSSRMAPYNAEFESKIETARRRSRLLAAKGINFRALPTAFKKACREKLTEPGALEFFWRDPDQPWKKNSGFVMIAFESRPHCSRAEVELRDLVFLSRPIKVQAASKGAYAPLSSTTQSAASTSAAPTRAAPTRSTRAGTSRARVARTTATGSTTTPIAAATTITAPTPAVLTTAQSPISLYNLNAPAERSWTWRGTFDRPSMQSAALIAAPIAAAPTTTLPTAVTVTEASQAALWDRDETGGDSDHYSDIE